MIMMMMMMTVCFVRNWSAVELVPLSTDQPTVLNDDDEEEHGHGYGSYHSGHVSYEDVHGCDDIGLVLPYDEMNIWKCVWQKNFRLISVLVIWKTCNFCVCTHQQRFKQEFTG